MTAAEFRSAAAQAIRAHRARRAAVTAAFVADGGDTERFNVRCPRFNRWQDDLAAAGRQLDEDLLAARQAKC